MNQIWIVEAVEICDDIDSGQEEHCALQWAFPDRATAHKVYAQGERTLRHMHWSLTMVPYGNVDNALHDIELLSKEQA
jgi:hypothetical protein